MTFSNLPLRRKQTLIIMLTSSAVLLLACVAFVSNEAVTMRREMVEKLSTLGHVIGNDCIAAIDFNDPEAAARTLQALRAEPNIEFACIYTCDNRPFAAHAMEAWPFEDPPPVQPPGHNFAGGYLFSYTAIGEGSDRIGTVLLVSNLDELTENYGRYAAIVGAIFLTSLTLALVLSSRLQRVVSNPILHLASVARQVAQEKNYSLRATKQGEDELGQLIDRFNEMLAQIQEQNAALNAARDQLEHRVEERTQELAGSLSLLHATLESTADGLLVVNHQGRVTSYNAKFIEMWRLPKNRVIAGDDNELLRLAVEQLKDAEQFLAKVRELYGNPEAESFDILELKDSRVFERHSQPQRLNGQCVGRVWSFRDITERKRAEDAVRQSQALYHSLVEQLPTGVFRKDAEGRYVFVNSWFCELKGMKLEELLGKTATDLLDYEKGELHIEKPEFAKLARQGVAHHEEIMRTGRRIEVDEDYPEANGATRYFHVIKSPVFGLDGKIIGTQGILYDVTQSRLAQKALAYERDLLQTLMDNLPDTIYFKDLESRFVRVSRSKLESAFAFCLRRHRAERSNGAPLPPHLANMDAFEAYLKGKTDGDLLTSDHAREALRQEQEIIRTGRPVLGQVLNTRNLDGSSAWVLSTKMPWRDTNGTIVGTFGISKDITALKEAEARIEAVHQELVLASRQAGMAEVATSVLHNVGNVLNSVNTSAGVIGDHLRTTKSAGLARVTELFERHQADLAGFLNHDGQVKRLIHYLKTLAEALVSERSAVLTELQELTRNIEHIKEIVAMQQSYARVSGVTEIQSPPVLVEDALRMNETGLARSRIQVVRQYENVPDVPLDKHKVLQILVNLVSNARHALAESPSEERRLTVGTRLTGERRLQIFVADNGVGIPPENLTRIFSHGFTTRENGHGFGLHSGALAAREMGGMLSVHSDGHGTGATFTLELPGQPQEQEQSS